jgi:hypothetical protein
MQEVKDLFSRSQHASELGKRGAKGIRTPDLLHAMRAGFVWRCLARSRFGTSGEWSCPAASGCICCDLGALSLGSSLVTASFGILDTDRKVVPLQTQLAAFVEPDCGDVLAWTSRIMGPSRLASYARTKDSHAWEEPGDRLPPYDPGRSG